MPATHSLIEALEQRLRGARLQSTHIVHPFLLRTFDPPIAALDGRRVLQLRRVGKRIAIGFEGDHWLVLPIDFDALGARMMDRKEALLADGIPAVAEDRVANPKADSPARATAKKKRVVKRKAA